MTSSCCSCHHAARTRPRWPPGPSNEAYLSSPHLEASPATTFHTCSSHAPTPVKPQPPPAILSQESVHTTLSITHHTRKRPSTGPRTTHGPHRASPLPTPGKSHHDLSVLQRRSTCAAAPARLGRRGAALQLSPGGHRRATTEGTIGHVGQSRLSRWPGRPPRSEVAP
jgi:hypothetical protein